MKKVCSIGLLLSMLFLWASCSKSETEPLQTLTPPEPNTPVVQSDTAYIVFGVFHSFCSQTDCVDLAKLEGETLLLDSMTNFYQAGGPVFYDAPQSMDKVVLAKDLFEALPELLKTEGGIVGCPNCSDQGAFYIELLADGEIIKWKLDTFKRAWPEEVKEFYDQLEATIGQLF